jgi:hypothetical protein
MCISYESDSKQNIIHNRRFFDQVSATLVVEERSGNLVRRSDATALGMGPAAAQNGRGERRRINPSPQMAELGLHTPVNVMTITAAIGDEQICLASTTIFPPSLLARYRAISRPSNGCFNLDHIGTNANLSQT